VFTYANPLRTHPDREAIHVNNFGLTDAVYSINSLELYCRVPPEILRRIEVVSFLPLQSSVKEYATQQEDIRRHREIESKSASLQGYQHDINIGQLELFNRLHPLLQGGYMRQRDLSFKWIHRPVASTSCHLFVSREYPNASSVILQCPASFVIWGFFFR